LSVLLRRDRAGRRDHRVDLRAGVHAHVLRGSTDRILRAWLHGRGCVTTLAMTNKPLSKSELWALGQAIAETPKRTASPRMRVIFDDWKVESSDGHVYVGDFGTPRSAIRIEGGDADNQIFYISSKLIDEGNRLWGFA
jgi:hypothetical protein